MAAATPTLEETPQEFFEVFTPLSDIDHYSMDTIELHLSRLVMETFMSSNLQALSSRSKQDLDDVTDWLVNKIAEAKQMVNVLWINCGFRHSNSECPTFRTQMATPTGLRDCYFDHQG